MPGGRPPQPIVERLWARIDKSVGSDACWHWPGALNVYGYGFLSEGSRTSRGIKMAHTVAYESVYGPVPEGLHLDHLCHGADLTCPGGGPACLHRRCVNPAHLEAVTQAENNRRMQARKTHCPKGHPLFGPNLYSAPGSKNRECRTCRKANRESWYKEKGLEYHRRWKAARRAS